MPTCPLCDDTMGGRARLPVRGAGMPCLYCNVSDELSPPRLISIVRMIAENDARLLFSRQAAPQPLVFSVCQIQDRPSSFILRQTAFALPS
jgi:hypothetical protein